MQSSHRNVGLVKNVYCHFAFLYLSIRTTMPVERSSRLALTGVLSGCRAGKLLRPSRLYWLHSHGISTINTGYYSFYSP